MQKAYVKYLSSHPSEYDFQVCEMSNKSLVTAHTWENKYKNRALNFTFRKLELNTIYTVHSNKPLFKYYTIIFWGVYLILEGNLKITSMKIFSGFKRGTVM